MEFTVKQIADLLSGTINGDESLKINRLSKIEEGVEGSISFLSNLKYEPFLYTTSASAVIVDREFRPRQAVRTTLLFVDNSYSAFTQLLEEVDHQRSISKVGVEQPSFLGENVEVGRDVYRGMFSYIGANTRLGKGVKIYPHTFIGQNVTIGDNTIIFSGVRIYDNTVIGRNCVIHANAVIGSDGFGFAPQEDGSYKTIPQVGIVLIEDDVSIGANTTIDRATMGSTTVRQGVKLDNLIMVGHNVEIGKNTVIAAQSGVAGSSKIGKNCVIAGQVGIVGHIQIADRTKIGAQSGIHKSIKEAGLSFNGSPAMNMNKNLRSLAVFQKLPTLEKRIQELERNLAKSASDDVSANSKAL